MVAGNSPQRREAHLSDLKRLVCGDLGATEYQELFSEVPQSLMPLRQVFDEMRRQSGVVLGIESASQNSRDENSADGPAN